MGEGAAEAVSAVRRGEGGHPHVQRTQFMRKKVIVPLALIGLVAVCIGLWPSQHYDPTRVHPSLRKLATPYQSVFTSYFLDGGSVGVRITDRDGRVAAFALPVGSGPGRSYPRLFVGTTHCSDTNAVEIAFTEDTRRMLISIIDRHQSPADSSHMALVCLRGAPQDHARIWGRAAVSACKRILP